MEFKDIDRNSDLIELMSKEELIKTLKKMLSGGISVIKNRIQELILKTDKCLLKILLNDELTKNMFFVNIDGIFVFDKSKFMWMIDGKDFLPDSYTAFKNKIMLIDEKGTSIKNSNEVVLEFPYKDCLLEMDSTVETEVREEVFFNEVLMKSEIDTLLSPKVLINQKRYSVNGIEDIDKIDKKDNLIIRGNNLLALSSLLPRYKGQIKCMYWDVLYNTDSDKVPYNDSFKHSSWLTMMKNRLDIAIKLLRDDGLIICVIIDKN